MFEERLNATELDIVRDLQSGQKSISQIALDLGRSVYWVSISVNRLKEMDIVVMENVGVSRLVKISANGVGESFSLLIREKGMLNLEKVLTGSGLKILPLLLPPGELKRDIPSRAGVSRGTVFRLFKRWREMGVISVNDETKRFTMSHNHEYLINFIEQYTQHRNIIFIRRSVSNATIAWQCRNEILITVNEAISLERFKMAGLTRLYDLGFELVYSSEYYFFSPQNDDICLEEAFIQALMVVGLNPRPKRMMMKAIRSGDADVDKLYRYAQKYNVVGKIEGVMKNGR